jgi:hypothetical protein
MNGKPDKRIERQETWQESLPESPASHRVKRFSYRSRQRQPNDFALQQQN